MIGKMLIGVVGIVAATFVIGVAHSGFKHYYEKYAEDEDMNNGSIQKVSIVNDETKKTRGKK